MDTILQPDTKKPAPPLPRRSTAVRKVGAELSRAVELRQMLGDDADPALVLDTIEGETELAEACCVVLEEIIEDETLLAGLQATINTLQTRKGRIEKSIEDRRNIILMAMQRAGLDVIKSPLGTMSAGVVPPKVIVNDEVLIPAAYWRPGKPQLDRAAVAEALKAGQQVPGAVLSNGGVNLRIRQK